MNHFCAHSEISCLWDMINIFGKKTNNFFALVLTHNFVVVMF